MAENHYHGVQFYNDEASLTTTVSRFLAEGLKAGQPALLIATPSHSQAIVHGLEELGLDPMACRQAGELLLLDAKTVLSSFMVDDLPESTLFKRNLADVIERLCAGRKPCPIRAYGEMVDLLWQQGNAEGAIKVEILWNQLATAYDFALLCAYAFGHFYKQTRDPRYEQICDLHTEVLDNAGAA